MYVADRFLSTALEYLFAYFLQRCVTLVSFSSFVVLWGFRTVPKATYMISYDRNFGFNRSQRLGEFCISAFKADKNKKDVYVPL